MLSELFRLQQETLLSDYSIKSKETYVPIDD